MTDKKPLTYREAGVDIDEGARLVRLIGPAAKSTERAGVLGGLGGFAAAFDLKAAGYQDPILLATTDGVGTKLKIAIEANRHQSVGVDLVAMCVNDLLAQGGEPIMFLDYFATGRLDAERGAEIIEGIAEGCRLAGCALSGGETAEMPGFYQSGEYDLAGFAIGAAERGALLPLPVQPGDALIGLASSGPHSNGYSLIRRIVARTGLAWTAPSPFGGGDLATALLTPTRIYVRSVLPLVRDGLVKAAAHVTGGGLVENVPRALGGKAARFDWTAWAVPEVFRWLTEEGALADEEARRTFNLGIGFVLAVSPGDVEQVLLRLTATGERAFVIGDVVE